MLDVVTTVHGSGIWWMRMKAKGRNVGSMSERREDEMLVIYGTV